MNTKTAMFGIAALAFAAGTAGAATPRYTFGPARPVGTDVNACEVAELVSACGAELDIPETATVATSAGSKTCRVVGIRKQALSCPDAEGVFIPAQVRYIYAGAFMGAYNMKSVIFLGDAPDVIEDRLGDRLDLFTGTPLDLEVYVPNGSLGWDGPRSRSLVSYWHDRHVTYYDPAILASAYSVEFKAGSGGTGTMQPLKCKVGQVYNLPQCGFSAANSAQHFAGWVCAETGRRYDDGVQVVDLVVKDGKVTMTAVWE